MDYQLIMSNIDNRLLKFRGRGYILGFADGKVFTFGELEHLGDCSKADLSSPITAVAARADGR
ncbi:MAG: hypothetical protein HKL83_04370, partial [Acidimicrobiaceae bacterium]|nr:hypothetical protein [Acidimicrobiaceae bacterium]